MTARFCCAILLIGALAAGGCDRRPTTGPGGEKVTESKADADKNISQPSDGDKDATLPADFPKDVPLYTGATVVSSDKSNEGRMVKLQTNDTTGEVEEFYEKNLKDQGWDVEDSVKMGEGTHYVCKKEKRNLSVSVSGSDKTLVVLVVQE
jgi:hypothetical protein